MTWYSRRASVLAVLSLLSARVHAQLESDGCLKLASSEACRAFDQYYVGITALAASTYPFLANVSNVASLDATLYAHIAAASPMQQLGCTNDTQYARYSLTHACALLVHDTGSLPCNYERNVSPEPMCQSSCNDWVDSVDTLLANSHADSSCSTTPLQQQCSGWPAFSGTDGNCVLGSANEPDNCGFWENMDAACGYCQSRTDPCCSSVSCSDGLSAGAIAGIVIGCLAAIAVAVAGIFWWRRRQRRASGGFVAMASTQPRAEDEARVNLVATATEEKTQLPSSTSVEMAEMFCEVAHGYQPQMEDEMELRVGDVVYLIFQLDDGWGYGLNLAASAPGVFPLICVVQAREELLEQLLLPSHTEKTLIEDDDLERASMLGSRPSPTTATTASSPLSASAMSSVSNSALAARMQEFRDNVRRSISINSLKRISRQPRPMPPVQIHHHDTMPARRVSSIHEPCSPPPPSAPPASSSPGDLALDAGNAYEMHRTRTPS